MERQEKRCVICGKTLPPRKKKYCSKECARMGENALARARGGIKIHPAPYHWITCQDCGREVYVHIKSKRCAACQRIADSRHQVEQRQRTKAGHVRHLGSTDFCERCGKPYIVNGGKQRYCRACAPVAYAQVKRKMSIEWNRENYATPEAREERNARKRAVKQYPKTCVVCGKSFIATDMKTLCCSDDCKKARMRDYWKEYGAQNAERRSKAQKTRYAAIMDDPEKRAERNRKAREYYAKRKKEHEND